MTSATKGRFSIGSTFDRRAALLLTFVSLLASGCEQTPGIIDDSPPIPPADVIRGGARTVFDFGTQMTFAMGNLQVEGDRCTVTGPRATAHCNVYDALFRVQGDISWSPTGRHLDRPLPILAWANGVDAQTVAAEALLDDPGRWNEPGSDWVYHVATYGQAEARAYFDASPTDWTPEPLEITCGGEAITEALVVVRPYKVEEVKLSIGELQAIIDDESQRVPPLTIGNGADAVFEYAGTDPRDCPPQQ